jgi:hypothetical protein
VRKYTFLKCTVWKGAERRAEGRKGEGGVNEEEKGGGGGEERGEGRMGVGKE